MKQYELMVIVNPDIGSDAINAKLEEIKNMISLQKGEISFEDLWGLRDLAYRIKKKDRGFYAVLNFTLESSGLQEMNSTLKIDADILRHLIVSLPAGYEPKSQAEREKEAELARLEKVVQPEKKAAAAKPAAPERKTEVKKAEVKAETATEKEVEAPAEKESKKKEEKSSLEDVDKKLSNLLDNPDLNF